MFHNVTEGRHHSVNKELELTLKFPAQTTWNIITKQSPISVLTLALALDQDRATRKPSTGASFKKMESETTIAGEKSAFGSDKGEEPGLDWKWCPSVISYCEEETILGTECEFSNGSLQDNRQLSESIHTPDQIRNNEHSIKEERKWGNLSNNEECIQAQHDVALGYCGFFANRMTTICAESLRSNDNTPTLQFELDM